MIILITNIVLIVFSGGGDSAAQGLQNVQLQCAQEPDRLCKVLKYAQNYAQLCSKA